MAIETERLDQLLAGRAPQELFSRDGLVNALKQALSERLLNTGLDAHPGSEEEKKGGNHRNGSSKKTMLTGTSKVTLDIPRDRAGTFDPKLIAKDQRRFPDFPDFDDKIVSMYARGMTVRAIRLEGLYGLDVSPDLISTVTDAVLEAVAEWQNGKPDRWIFATQSCFLTQSRETVRVKTRDEGFAEAINATFPEPIVRTCIVHLIRHSMNFTAWKDRRDVARALRTVYRAREADAALEALDAFEAGPWGEKYPAIAS